MRQREVYGQARWGARCTWRRPQALLLPLLVLRVGGPTLPMAPAALHRAQHIPHSPTPPEGTHVQARVTPPEPLRACPRQFHQRLGGPGPVALDGGSDCRHCSCADAGGSEGPPRERPLVPQLPHAVKEGRPQGDPQLRCPRRGNPAWPARCQNFQGAQGWRRGPSHRPQDPAKPGHSRRHSRAEQKGVREGFEGPLTTRVGAAGQLRPHHPNVAQEAAHVQGAVQYAICGGILLPRQVGLLQPRPHAAHPSPLNCLLLRQGWWCSNIPHISWQPRP